MTDLLVVMVCTKEAGLHEMYKSQLSEAGIAYHVEMVEESSRQDTLGWEILMIRQMLDRFSDVKTFIFTDGWDVLFYGAKEDVISRIPEFKVLIGAERNCYPDPSLTNKIQGKTPWKFANGGLLAGHRESIERWCSAIQKSPFYKDDMCNQGFFNMCLYMDGMIPNAVIDSRTELFYCLYQDKGELDFDKGLPVNKLYQTRPNFIHANGKWPFVLTLKKRDESLGIQSEQNMAKLILHLPMEIEICEPCRTRRPEHKMTKFIVNVPVQMELCESCRGHMLKGMMP